MSDLREYERSRLWQSGLGPKLADPDERLRNHLRVAFEKFRDRCRLLAADVGASLPTYTVHDISHLDALWETADLIAGDSVPVNALEAFILGGAFLLHDLGMAAAAYSTGKPLPDAVPDLWKEGMHRIGVSDTAIADLTTAQLDKMHEYVLRQNHARKAESLAVQAWTDKQSGETYHLIDDPDLRFQFGALIGKLAHSHWWSVRRLSQEFNQVYGAPGDWPQEWTIDALKLACLVRAADAAHIDIRRSPVFLRLTRSIDGISADHWTFQQHLSRPICDSSRLRFSSMHNFSPEESRAWWVCYDVINMIDSELSSIDDLLSDRVPRLQFAVRGVVGAHDPRALARYVPTVGWVPIDARPHITEIPKIIRSLGGKNLYGTEVAAPFRELIQNGIDAVQVLRTIVPGEFRSAGLEISEIVREDGKRVLSFSDQGVGMSESAITGGLLDFGNTYWSSDAVREDLPGLVGKRPELSARFGIGFYSVFSLGDEVRVITRRFDKSADQTLVLEFTKGLDERPLLRTARDDERRWSSGTSVSVVLSDLSWSRISERRTGHVPGPGIEHICRSVAAFAIVPIVFRAADGSSVEISDGSDVMQMSPEEVIARCMPRSTASKVHALAKSLRPIDRDGQRLAMAAVAPWLTSLGPTAFRFSRIGIRIQPVDALAGYFRASVIRATRDLSTLDVTPAELNRWAVEQYGLVKEMKLKGYEQLGVAKTLRALRVDAIDFPIAWGPKGYFTRGKVAELYGDVEFIIVLTNSDYYALERDDDRVVFDCPYIVMDDRYSPPNTIALQPILPSLDDVMLSSVADAWNISVEQLTTTAVENESKHDGIKVGAREFSGLEVIADNAMVLTRSGLESIRDRLLPRVEA